MKKVLKKINKILFNDKFITAFFIASIVILSVLISLRINREIVYKAINGDFQTYNMVRRLLSGQIPFKDFFVYVGLGPLYLCSLLTLPNNTFWFNLVVVDAGSIIIFCCLLSLIIYLFTKSKKVSIISSALFIAITYGAILFTDSLNVDNLVVTRYLLNLTKSLYYFTITDNSIRSWRNFIVTIIAILMLVSFRNGRTKIRSLYRKSGFYLGSAVLGALGSIIILWSNDYGVASYITLSFCYFLWMLINKKLVKTIFGTIIYSASTLLFIYLIISLVTLGHFTEWFKYTLSVSQYQSWYYLFSKNLLFKSIYFDFVVVVYIGIVIFNIVVILKKKNMQGTSFNYIMLFILLSNLIASYIYHIGSCNYNLLSSIYILFDIFVLVVVPSLIWRKLNLSKKAKKILLYPAYILMILIIAVLAVKEINYKVDKNSANYVDGRVEGVVYKYGSDLNEIDNIIGESSYFSTYASALEAMRNEFHPTEFDYIIHVLGDDYRQEYLDNFTVNDYDYVLTIDRSYSGYEGWVQNANWYFYRQIFLNYQQLENIGYNIIWKKSDNTAYSIENINVEVVRTNEHTVDIYIKIDEDGCYIADIKLDYMTQIKTDGVKGVHHSMVQVYQEYIDDSEFEYSMTYYNYFNIPKESDKYYIPVYIQDGIGHVTLKYIPENYGYLEIENITLENIFVDYWAENIREESLHELGEK